MLANRASHVPAVVKTQGFTGSPASEHAGRIIELLVRAL